VADWQSIDLATESVQQFVDGALDASRTGHPGGDLIGQVVWLANVGSVWAGGLKAGQFVTCGSWSGANRVGPTAKVHVKFAHVGEVLVDFSA
jgi:2-keto-4-pentenoate hydratase